MSEFAREFAKNVDGKKLDNLNCKWYNENILKMSVTDITEGRSSVKVQTVLNETAAISRILCSHRLNGDFYER
ncbi:MAG: hypothetical protein IKM46_00650 [Clostridia bacterium]|nr:hypothetical protein [Clostridia bacterium]